MRKGMEEDPRMYMHPYMYACTQESARRGLLQSVELYAKTLRTEDAPSELINSLVRNDTWGGDKMHTRWLPRHGQAACVYIDPPTHIHIPTHQPQQT